MSNMVLFISSISWEIGKEYQLIFLIAQSKEDLNKGVLISSLEIEKVEGREVVLEEMSIEIMAWSDKPRVDRE